MTWSPMFLIRWLHKWFGLVLGLQFLLWAVSGATMALLDHHKVAAEDAVLPVAQLAAPADPLPLARVAEVEARAGQRFGDPAHPLLRRLQLEAPGTYHHSVIVGNLAEAAAEAVGADALLARVGTYYHDVGKIRRPAFFVENQMGTENPHDRMTPSLSALTVAAHVRDGLDLAREYRLPEMIADFIPEHHGTTVMSYFYHQALERGDQPEPGAYRYDGPKPQTRETAIVMLADAAEAAVRTLQRPTPDRIYEVVRRIIHERLEDGQLDECDLMFRDLEKIAQAFTRILTSIFHPRIEYPDPDRDLTPRRRERVRAR